MNKSGFVIVDNGLHQVGLNDKDGNEILPCIYDNILDYDDDGYVRFIKNGIYGTIDLQGKAAIPLSAGLTHLGVFYEGSARASKGDKWGLVDTKGDEVTGFCYKKINAYHNGCYKAFTMNDIYGSLSDDGKFTSSGHKAKPQPQYSTIAAYRNDVAPALKYKDGWVFIDRNQNRINDIEYWSMDHVLRHGIYEVAKSSNEYGIAKYNGTPVIDEWYSHPVHFENGFAECHKLFHDENGNEVTLPSGQPRYNYGILKMDGTYLFPLVYSSLHWNDYKKKDCWFAEDDKACYLLFQDGSRRVYHKYSADRSSSLPYIPLKEYNNNISEEVINNRYEPKLFMTKYYQLFDKNKFKYALYNWTGYWGDPLKFFYRDTDAPIDLNLYKKGSFIRAGAFMATTDKLIKPVHKTRFLIAARRMISVSQYLAYQRTKKSHISYKEYVIHCNACFLVMDIQQFGGVTQIVLLQMPHGAIELAKKNNVRLNKTRARSEDGYGLSSASLYDLQTKMGSYVHEYSLSDYWNAAMSQPIGLDKHSNPVPLDLQKDYQCTSEYNDENNFYRYCDIVFDDKDYEWQQNTFMKIQSNTIKLVVGDIAKLEVDNHIANIAAHTPVSNKDKTNGAKLLKSGYNTVLKIAQKENFKSIAFPSIDAATYNCTKEEAAEIMISAIVQHLKAGKYKGYIIICCPCDEDVSIYQHILEDLEI